MIILLIKVENTELLLIVESNTTEYCLIPFLNLLNSQTCEFKI